MKKAMKYGLAGFFTFLVLTACHNEKESDPVSDLEVQAILDQLASDYDPMPEGEITRSSDNRVFAQYAKPTEKYGHGILGDKIEAEQLVVVADGVFYELILQSDYVFEDISPRLYDVDGDGEEEIITIRTHMSRGAGIAIYKTSDGELTEFARVTEIGKSNRWLNIVAIADLDHDKSLELVWIQTPHIGGILKVAEIQAGSLEVLAEKQQYSNHAIGERNLCLSVLTEQEGKKVFYVPGQSRDKIIGFTYENKDLEIFEEIIQNVDFSKPLHAQYSFNNVLEGVNNCLQE